jgi:N-formylglutamate amidohydrolase
MQQPVSTWVPSGAAIPVLVSVPHAGRHCPAWLAERARVPLADLRRLSDPWSDLIAAPLFARGARVVKANALRAAADCNRHESDMDPADTIPALRPQFGPPGRKARAGLGVVPTRLPSCGPLWRGPISNSDFEERLDWVHRPFHRALAAASKAMLARFGTILLIDLHSMPSLPATRSDPHPAKIIIGDRFGSSADPGLSALAAQNQGPMGVRIGCNAPYPGGHIIGSHGAPSRGVHALQIEFDRSLYLDANGHPDAGSALALGDWLSVSTARWLEYLNQQAGLMAAE